jgi:hypothetical protein
VESIPVPPENDKECIDVSHTEMHYVTYRSQQMQKHKFDLMCPDALFMETVLVPAKHE